MTEPQIPAGQKLYDVFLSYSTPDRPLVERIANRLRETGLRPWFDQWSILHGQEVQRQLESGLSQSRAIAVFVGKDGLGPWEETEFRAAFMEKLRETESRIIPVLLPGSEAVFKSLPSFLLSRAYVDFRDGLDNPIALTWLIAGIEGLRADELLAGPVLLDRASRPIARHVLTALQAQTIRAYDSIAEKFTEKWFDHPPGEILEILLEHLPQKSSILDAGCGPAHHARYLKKAGHDVLGIDLSPEMLRIAKAKTEGIPLVRMDMRHLEFSRETFDCVWCAAAGVHVPREDLTSQLFAFKRVLKPRGVLGLSLQVDRTSEIAADRRFFEFYESKAEVANLLSYVGFSIVAEAYAETRRNTHDLDITLKWITYYAKPISPSSFMKASQR